MEAHIRSFTLLAMALTVALGTQPATAQQTMDFHRSELIRSLLPTVVNITSTVPASAPGSHGPVANVAASQPQSLAGSGFIIDPSGLIATNNHVIAGAYRIQVTFSDGHTAPAKLVAASKAIDIAVIRVDTQHSLVAVRWGDSNKLQIGEPVFAIGNPLGIGMSVSSGIISALNRNINDSPYDNFIQTDASINHGNSGGPLFNRAGEVIGMDTAIISPTRGSAGLGFAQPSEDVKFVTDRLIRNGSVKPGWAGAKAEDVTPELAQALGMQSPEGSIIAALSDGGPAAAAGLQIGDVVLRFNGQTPSDVRALRRAVAKAPIDQMVPVTVLRDGQERSFQVMIKQKPETAADIRAQSTQPAAPAVAIPPDLGLSLSAMSNDVREKYGLDAAQAGVVINGVSAGTDAAMRGLSPGDVILHVQGRQVQTPDQVQSAIDVARTQHRLYVAALVLRKMQDSPGPIWVPLRVSPG